MDDPADRWANGEAHATIGADPGKYGHAQKCEGPYGSTFVATTIYKKGHRLYNEWVPEEDYKVAVDLKILRLAQDQAFLKDNNYLPTLSGISPPCCSPTPPSPACSTTTRPSATARR